jgi:hypothetical protein
MKSAIALFLFLHGLAHVVGFASAFRLLPGIPYKTTVAGGRVDLGEAGIRELGSVWMILALGFAAAAVGLLAHAPWTTSLLVLVTFGSLLLCAVNLPEAKIGLLLDVLILIGMAAMTVGPMLFKRQ